jgi:hypothetical protein
VTATFPTNATASSLYLKCGGSPVVDEAGHAWLADDDYFSASAQTATGSVQVSVANIGNVPLAVYQTERSIFSPNFMTYTLPLAPGLYVLTLYFAETHLTTTNTRVFDVFVDGQLVLKNLDVVAEVGPSTAYSYSLQVPVTSADPTITIMLAGGPIAKQDNPMINGISAVPFFHPGVCQGCPTATFAASSLARSCTPWSEPCAAGTFVATAPTSSQDRVCAACSDGSFSTEV